MPIVPASPRIRRRLRLAAVSIVLLGTGLAIALLVPETRPVASAPAGTEGPAQLADTSPRSHLSRADRAAIDAVLDRFIPAGMERGNPALAWALAGPELKASTTLGDWRAGNSPVPYYLARERSFHHWRTIDAGKRYVIFNLLLHPRHPKRVGTYVFSGEVVKPGRRWLVNRLYTIAVMNPPGFSSTMELGPADFAAPGAAGQGPPTKVKHGFGILPIVLMLGLVLLIPLGIGAVALVRARRWRRRVRTETQTGLPPLPASYLRATEERREQVPGG